MNIIISISRLFLCFLILTSFSFFQNSNKAYASHIMGGEITAQYLGNLQYEITGVLYRDIQGIPIPTTFSLNISEINGPWGIITGLPLDTAFYDTLTLSNGVLIGFQAAYFKSVVIFPNSGSFNLEWETCCRNAAILNCSNPGGQGANFSSVLEIPALPDVNSTPEFLAPPVSYVSIDSMWQHNPLPFDADGDSLVWSIDTPWTSASFNVPGWTTPNAHPGGAFTINQFTGEITWTPNTLGNFIATVLVDEYRNGVKIGEIRRDMQLIVVPDSLTSPRIGNFSTLPTDANGNAKINVAPGSVYSLTLLASDSQNDFIEFTSYGEPYMLSSNPATFTSVSTTPGQASGMFSWTPNAAQARLTPYLVSFRVSDGLLAFDESLLIEVGSFTGVEESENNSIGTMYPNPVKNILFVPIGVKENSLVTFEVYNILGTKVVPDKLIRYNSGSHLERFDMDLSPGIYFMRIINGDMELGTRKFIIHN